MPAKSEAQRRLFAVAEHNPGALYDKNKSLANLPHQTLHDFASKVVPSAPAARAMPRKRGFMSYKDLSGK